MENSVQSQIYNGCHLAMPEGLKDLMSDISREVLRAQPDDLYHFITNYLGALLDAREALSIACRICGKFCRCSCYPELNYEMERIGLSDEDVEKAKKIIQEHFDGDQVKETNLLLNLARKISVTDLQLADLLKAIQRAFRRHLIKKKGTRMQVSFAKVKDDEYDDETGSTEQSSDSTQSNPEFYTPMISKENTPLDHSQAKELSPASSGYMPCILTESATTLAGSYINLPYRIPYSVHNSEVADDSFSKPYSLTL